MQKGGSMTPQINQQARQTGVLPKMQMGNDITQMHMRQASHYGFQNGGQQQEEVDQSNLSPLIKYNQRVSEFLNNLKQQAMLAVQDDMLSTNNAYAEEANAISGMPMAQYGMQYNQMGIDAAKAWEEASKKRTNTIEPLINAASMATGLKGYWGDEDAFAANPYNTQYIKKVKYKNIKGTEPVIPVQKPGKFSETEYYDNASSYDEGGPVRDANGNLLPGYKYVRRPGYMGSMETVLIGPDGLQVAEGVDEMNDAQIQAQKGMLSTKLEGDKTNAALFGTIANPRGLIGLVGRMAYDQFRPTQGGSQSLLTSGQGASTEVGPFTGNLANYKPNLGLNIKPNAYSIFSSGSRTLLPQYDLMTEYKKREAEEKKKAADAEFKRLEEERKAKKDKQNAAGSNTGSSTNTTTDQNTNGSTQTGSSNQGSASGSGSSNGSSGSGSGSGSSSGSGSTGSGSSSGAPAGTETGKGFKEGDIVKADGSVWRDGVMIYDGKGTIMENNPDQKTKKGTGDGYDYLRALADPNSMQAGAIYTTDKKGNQVPMAFYDPNLRVISTTADYRGNIGNIFRKEANKKRGAMKSFTVRYGTLADGTPVAMDESGNVIQQPQQQHPQQPITQSPNVNDITGAKEFVPPYPGQSLEWSTGQQLPMPGYLTDSKSAIIQPGTSVPGTITSMDDLVPGGITVGPQGAGSSVVPQNAPLTPEQQEKIDKINARTKRRVGDINQDIQNIRNQQKNTSETSKEEYTPVLLDSQSPGTLVQGRDGKYYFKDANGNIHSSNDQNSLTQKRNSMGLTGKKNGGSLNRFMRQYGNGGPGTTSATDWQNMFKTAFDDSDMQLADQGPIDPDTGLPVESALDKPMTDAERVKIFDSVYYNREKEPNNPKIFKNIKEAKYKFGKYNPFLAPAMMAGLDTLAGVAQNKDAAQKERELRSRLAFDQIGFKVPQTSGDQGDWTFNEGYIRPNDMVPVQFTGAGPMAAMGGSFNEGDELYLDDDTINAILAMGGEIEYLD